MKIYKKVEVNFKKACLQPYNLYFLITFLLISLIINIYMYILFIYILDEIIGNTENFINVPEEIVNKSTIKDIKNDFFNPLIELFNKNNSRYIYFPSYFTDSSVKISSGSYFPENLPLEKSNIISNINTYQNYMLESYNSNYINLLYDLHDIIVEYIDISRIIIQ